MNALQKLTEIHNWKFSRTQNETGQRSNEVGEWIGSSPMNPELITKAADYLVTIISESQSCQRALVEKSDELTTEWKRAEMAEAQLAALRVRVEAVERERDAMREALKDAIALIYDHHERGHIHRAYEQRSGNCEACEKGNRLRNLYALKDAK